jgi:hypothetical protein
MIPDATEKEGFEQVDSVTILFGSDPDRPLQYLGVFMQGSLLPLLLVSVMIHYGWMVSQGFFSSQSVNQAPPIVTMTGTFR